jgi:hypothetical protein
VTINCHKISEASSVLKNNITVIRILQQILNYSNLRPASQYGDHISLPINLGLSLSY